ncbi:MAG: NAD(P)/FAD-dependent oxidoreductase [Pseudomonadales bacterium]|nr:NAD(P)/FAD-dependent oxidoreductase [Pseudomonadales bacterium]
MSESTLESDYLVIGAGAMGMAFTDSILAESDATVTLIDRYHRPGGHWTRAYPFVRLHQPSAFYGVNSRTLGSDAIDAAGWNAGLAELATSGEVCAYFDQVMQQQFLPSGRVRFLPMHEYEGAGRCRSLGGDQVTEVDAQTVVDASYMNVTVPSMRPPPFPVNDDAHCVAVNAVPEQIGHFDRFVVIGAGKTGMDACLFLLQHGVEAASIRWVMPRDSWYLNRANIQPGRVGVDAAQRVFMAQSQIFAEANSVEALFSGVEASGQLLRLDRDVEPSMYRCATVTERELEALRALRPGIIRKGRVVALQSSVIELEHGEAPTDTGTLHIDCTADGLALRPATPIFAGGQITLQAIRFCQQVFSAAFIGHVAVSYASDAERNALCTPIPHPDSALDYLRVNLANTLAMATWAGDPALQAWLKRSRLDGFTQADVPDPDPSDPAVAAAFNQVAASIENLTRLLAESA